MKTENVAKLTPLERFLYWIKERHQIYLRRKAGKPKPWTDDEVLQRYFFTNPYRENDKTTVWFRENVREPLRDDPAVLMATVIFRWFNYIPTGQRLLRFNLLRHWDKRHCVSVLENQPKVFTGAYMIGGVVGEPKLQSVCRRIDQVWVHAGNLIRGCSDATMQEATRMFKEHEGLGAFMAYEIVCDLRYTDLLEHATDKLTWANPGPGALRGLRRLEDRYGRLRQCTKLETPVDKMVELLAVTRKRLSWMPTFELREVEHSLCEYDKYCRALFEGRSKRKYNGSD